jgi:hypothetical protein
MQKTVSIFLFVLVVGMGCKSYTNFKVSGDDIEILSTHRRSPQPYCQKIYSCLNEKYQIYGWQYCIISPCCTGTYFDTTGLHQQEIDYAKTHRK